MNHLQKNAIRMFTFSVIVILSGTVVLKRKYSNK